MLWTVCRGVGGAEGDKQGDVQYTAARNSREPLPLPGWKVVIGTESECIMRVAMNVRQEGPRWSKSKGKHSWFWEHQSGEIEKRQTKSMARQFNCGNSGIDREVFYYPYGRWSTNFRIWCGNQKIQSCRSSEVLPVPGPDSSPMILTCSVIPGSRASDSEQLGEISQLITWLEMD